MEKQIYVIDPWVQPIIEQHGMKYVIYLKLGHFRELAASYATIDFDSEKGRDLSAAVGIVTCRHCSTSAITAEKRIGLRCLKCGSMTDRRREEQPEEEALGVSAIEVER